MNAARRDAQLESDAFKLEMYQSGLLFDDDEDERVRDEDEDDEDDEDDDDGDGNRKNKIGKAKESKRFKRVKRTFINMGEDSNVPGHEDAYQLGYDEITSTGHHHLEQHREFRHYARLAAWEMPLLASKCFR